MTNETRGISVKELLVFVPAAGSAMALSWEVGSFLPIGGGSFMLFSLSEHLLFAVQALPVALALVSTVLLAKSFAFGTPIDRATNSAVAKVEGSSVPSDADPLAANAHLKIRLSRLRRGVAALRLLYTATGLLTTYWGFQLRSAAFIVFGLRVVGAGMLAQTPTPKSRQLPLFCWLLLASLGFAMALGSDQSRALLTNEWNIVEVKVRQVTKKAVLVRSGERGVLLFEPQTGRFSVEKWDVVEGLDWQRAPLDKMIFPDRKTPVGR